MTEKNPYCKYCNYKPKRPCDFKKHLKTKRHHKNLENHCHTINFNPMPLKLPLQNLIAPMSNEE